MSPQSLLEVESVEIDGRELHFARATISFELVAVRPRDWHVELFHPAQHDLDALPNGAVIAVRTLEGLSLRGRVSRADTSPASGCIRLNGVGVLQRG